MSRHLPRLFQFERSTREELKAARALWRRDAAKLPLSAVHLRTGELVADDQRAEES